MQAPGFTAVRSGSLHTHRERIAGNTPRCALGKRALGVDYGLSRVGLAVSIGISPRPLSRVDTRDIRAAAAAVAAAARENVADEIVLGLPLNASGEIGEQAQRTLAFAAELTRAAPAQRLLLIDERFTTQEADARLGNKCREERLAARDSVAAAGILERYFSAHDEARAEVFYEPEKGKDQWSGRGVEVGGKKRQSFAEWKSEMKRAASEQAAVLGEGKHARRKRKRKKR